jgi:hypothetical protein
MGPLPPALLALLLAAPAAFAQPAPDLSQLETALDRDLDPYAAIEFLKRTDVQHAIQAYDPDREAHLVEQATALKDMSDLLVSYFDGASMNEALRMRLGDDDANTDSAKLLGFGAHPANLLAWREKYMNYVPVDRLETALWEWKTLSAEQRAWLSDSPRSYTEDKWEALSFTRRFMSLHDWASAIYGRLMKESPKTPGELATMQRDQYKIWGVMNGDEKRLSSEYAMKAAAAVAGLQQLDKLPPSVLGSSDPAMKDLLAKARSGATPLETLAALSALFDKAGVKNDAVQTQAPDRPDQKFSSLDPKVFNEMLATGLIAQIDGTDAGHRVAQFYQTHPLTVQVKNLPTAMAQFEPGSGAIVFNERFLTDWVKSQGLSAQAVVSDAARFHELVMTLSSTFVHESTHKMQKAYADDHGIYTWAAQHQEIEAMEVQSDYVLEKEARDPGYREFLARAQEHSYFVKEDVSRTAAFARDPRMFHETVMNDYYSNLPSLEIVESDFLLFLDTNIAALRAEKLRRAALPAPELAELEKKGFDKDKDFKTMREWKVYLMTVKSGVIDQLIAKDSTERDKDLKTYELTNTRQAEILDRVETHAAGVIRGDPPPARDDVPSPGAPR